MEGDEEEKEEPARKAGKHGSEFMANATKKKKKLRKTGEHVL